MAQHRVTVGEELRYDADVRSLRALSNTYAQVVAVVPTGDTTGARDAAAIQTAIGQAYAAGGGTVFLAAGTYYVNTTVQLHSNVHLRGAGERATVIAAASGSTGDVIATAYFATLTGTNQPRGAPNFDNDTSESFSGPFGFSVRELTIDGNKTANPSGGWGLRLYGYNYKLADIIVRRCATGGVYSEWGTRSYTPEATAGDSDSMESVVRDIKVHHCGGVGYDWHGPHDSKHSGIMAYRNTGINIRVSGNTGTELWTNCHAYGDGRDGIDYNWYISSSEMTFVNCVCDGAGLMMNGSANSWIGGPIYGAGIVGAGATSGPVAITMGDGTASVNANRFLTRITGYGRGTGLVRFVSAAANIKNNRFQINGNFSGTQQYAFGPAMSTATTDTTFPAATTLTLADASAFPSSGTGYASYSAANASITWTGKTGNQLTGVTVSPSTTIPAGSYVFQSYGSVANDFWDLDDQSQKGIYSFPQIGGAGSLVAMNTPTTQTRRATFQDGIATKNVGSTTSLTSAQIDALFNNTIAVADGLIAVDATNKLLLFRAGGKWQSVSGTQIT